MTASVTLGASKQSETDVAAATTTNIGATPTAKVRITGSGVSITSFGSVANKLRIVRFGGAVTIVHSASLFCGGAANISTAAGDVLIAMSDDAGNWSVSAVPGTGFAPASADYLVKTASGALSAELVVTDTASITWDWTTAGQAKAVRAALTGDVTASAGANATTIANDAVTYAKMQNISAQFRILGRKSVSAGDTEECTLSEVLDFIGSAAQGDLLYRGASAWARLGAGTSGQFLRTGGAAANPAWSGVALAEFADLTTGIGLLATEVPRNAELGGAAYTEVADIRRWPFVSTASTVTLTASHARRAYLVTAAATVTLPAASACDDDWMVLLKARGGTITLAAAGSDTIDGAASISITTGNRALVLRTSATSFEVF